MSEIKFKVYDLTTAQLEFDNVLEILEDNEAELNNLISGLENYAGKVIQELINQIQEFSDMHYQMKEEMDVAKSEIMEIEGAAKENYKPISDNGITKLNTPEVLAALKGIGDVLSENLCVQNLSPSREFTDWINRKDNELNDGIYEAVLNPIDEFKQREAENTYRSNQIVYVNAYEEFISDLTFHSEIDFIQQTIKEIGGIDKDKFPVIMQGDLYETLFEGTVGVTYNDFTESVTDKYEVDTNGVMPDSVLGQVTIGVGVVAAAVFGGGEAIAGLTTGIELLSSIVATGYEWLISIPGVNRLSKWYVEFVTDTFKNTMTLGAYEYVNSFEEATSNMRVLITSFSSPLILTKFVYTLVDGSEELAYDIEKDDIGEFISDLADYFLIPGDMDIKLGGDTYGS